MDGRRLSVALSVLLVAIALAACTATKTKPALHPTLAPAAYVVLDCAAGSPDIRSIETNLRVTDMVGTVFVRNPVENIPRAGDVGIPSPSPDEWKFNKSPLLLTAGAGTVTISVPDDGRQYLLWVPTAVWVNGSTPARMKPWITHQVTAAGCPSTGVAFLGGLLAHDPTRCFFLTIEGPDGVRDKFDVRADGLPCPQ